MFLSLQKIIKLASRETNRGIKMNDKRGLNFIVGITGLWVLWKLYWSGWLHRIGLMTVSYATGQDFTVLLDGHMETFSGGELVAIDQSYGVTPLAAFASLIIDAVVIFGSLIIMLATGIWELCMYLGTILKDLFERLSEYLQEYKNKKKNDKPTPKPSPVEKDKRDKEVETEAGVNPVEVILLSIKELQKQQEDLQEQINKKVEVTPVVEVKNNE